MTPGTAPAAPPAPAPAADPAALPRLVWRHRGRFLAVLLPVLALALLAAAALPPRWRAAARVLLAAEETHVVDLKAVLAGPAFDRDQLQDQVEILRSTALLERVIAAEGLAGEPDFAPDPGPAALLPAALAGLAPRLAERLADLGLRDAPPPPDPAEAAAAARRARLEALRAGLDLRPVPNSRVVEIGFTAAAPDLAARIANAVARAYIEGQAEERRAATREATAWLAAREADLRARAAAAEEAVAAARADLAAAEGQGLETTRHELRDLAAALALARSARSDLEVRAARLALALGEAAADPGTVSELRASRTIEAMREEEAALLARRAALAPSLPAGHPALARLDARLGELRLAMREEAGRIARALDRDLDAAKAREAALGEAVRALEAKALDRDRSEIRLRQLEREAEAGRALHETVLARLKETAAQEDLQRRGARLLSPAEPPAAPEPARRLLVLAGGLLLGLSLATGAVLLRARRGEGLREAAETEALTGLPLLGLLPRLPGRFRPGPDGLPAGPGAAALAEAARGLRTALLGPGGAPAAAERTARRVLVTSALPREGKSATALLLAAAAARAGLGSLLVDADLRRPALAGLLGRDGAEAGGADLRAVLAGTAAPEAAVRPGAAGAPDLLPAGPARPAGRGGAAANPADLLAAPRLEAALAALAAGRDLVVIDAPPVLAVADACILAPRVDAVLLAIRWDATPAPAVAEALRALRAAGAPLAGCVLTLAGPGPEGAGRGADAGLYAAYHAA